MFPYHCRGIKVFVLLCVTVLLVVYSLQQSSWNNSDILGKSIVHIPYIISSTVVHKNILYKIYVRRVLYTQLTRYCEFGLL